MKNEKNLNGFLGALNFYIQALCNQTLCFGRIYEGGRYLLLWNIYYVETEKYNMFKLSSKRNTKFSFMCAFFLHV